jgi:ubiquinone/menaquinone biosynthesis C-methylase UbiE
MTTRLETIFVKNVYNEIADDFDRTRFSHWEFILGFIKSLETGKTLLDLGCGNGKYLSVRNDLELFALDNCENLIKIVNKKYPSVKTFITDVSETPFLENTFDYIISIAVIHHLETEKRRIDMITEILRILKPFGKALITAWGTEHSNMKTLNKSTKISETNDWLIPWQDKRKGISVNRFYHLFEMNEFEKLLENFSNLRIIEIKYERDNWNVIIQKIS